MSHYLLQTSQRAGMFDSKLDKRWSKWKTVEQFSVDGYTDAYALAKKAWVYYPNPGCLNRRRLIFKKRVIIDSEGNLNLSHLKFEPL